MDQNVSSPSGKAMFNERVWKIVKQIPAGKVATYGQIANLVIMTPGMDLGQYRAFGARWVGGAMAACPEGVPWQRVINSQGKISLPGSTGEKQRNILEEEGVEFDTRGKINLKIYQWAGPGQVDATAERLPGF
jgi:methylated-DNA-protein-cysteine methyltransferase-like protein